MVQLLKQQGGKIPGPAFGDTPAGQYLGNKGIGIGPHHNPHGDSGGGIMPGKTSPWGDIVGFDENGEPIHRNKGGGHVGSGSGLDPNGGSMAGQLKDKAKKGKNGDDDDGSSDPTNGDGLFGGLPAPPEIVNPDPVSRGFVLVSPLGSPRGARAGSLAKARAAGPANAAFQLGAFGPAGAGRTAARPTAVLQGGR